MAVDQVVPLADTPAIRAMPHLSDEESRAKGKQARSKVPRDDHAKFEPGQDRPDPVALLESQAPSRAPELVPIRYGRMLVSPFTFFRGAALVMASDLSGTPRSGLNAQICGDAHLSNFGVFGSPERQLVFDCNDFDETLPGPWEWDVKRLAASIVVAGRHLGFSKANRLESIIRLGQRYREVMRMMASMSNLEVWYSRVEIEGLVEALKQHAADVGLQVRGPHGSDRIEDHVQGDDEGLHAGAEQADPRRRRETCHRQRPATRHDPRRSLSGRRFRTTRIAVPRSDPQVPAEPADGPQALARAIQVQPDRPQGRRRRQRRHPLLDHSHARRPPRRRAVPPGQGGRGIGPGAFHQEEPVQQPRRPGRGRPAAHAGEQ